MATNALVAYILPIKGLGVGTHHYSFEVDTTFFQAFENSPITDSSVHVKVALDKKPRMLVLDFDFEGTVATACDRCLTNIQLPIGGEQQLIAKFGEASTSDEEEDVVYLPLDASSWSIAQYIYEYILLALPLIKVYDCDNDDPPPCDQQMLDKLSGEETKTENTSNPFRDAFKDWNSGQ